MKKLGLAALGVAGACAACCAIPLAIPIIGTLSISGLSLLAIDQFDTGSLGMVLVEIISLSAAVWAGAWYLGQHRRRWAAAQNGAACPVPDNRGNGGCSCAKEVS